MAIDEYKAIHPFAVYDVPPAPAFVPIWSMHDWAMPSNLLDLFTAIMSPVSEDCKQETFAEDSSDFA